MIREFQLRSRVYERSVVRAGEMLYQRGVVLMDIKERLVDEWRELKEDGVGSRRFSLDFTV